MSVVLPNPACISIKMQSTIFSYFLLCVRAACIQASQRQPPLSCVQTCFIISSNVWIEYLLLIVFIGYIYHNKLRVSFLIMLLLKYDILLLLYRLWNVDPKHTVDHTAAPPTSPALEKQSKARQIQLHPHRPPLSALVFAYLPAPHDDEPSP